VLVPSTSGFGARRAEHRYNTAKKFCNRCSPRAVMSFKGAKKRFQTTNEANYEKKPNLKNARRRIFTAANA